MSGIRLKDGSSLNVVGLLVLGAIVAVIIFGALIIMPTVSMYRNPPTLPPPTRDPASSASKYVASLNQERNQVDGRSMFYIPQPPDAKVTEGPVAKTYEGPSLLAFVNGTAWFTDGQKVSAKEPEGKTVRFISAKPPWSVRVRWRGTEFDVKLFDKTELSSLSSPSSLNSNSYYPPPALAAPKPGESPGDRFPPEARIGPGAAQPGTASSAGTLDSPPPPPPLAPAGSPTPAAAPGSPVPPASGGSPPPADPAPASGAPQPAQNPPPQSEGPKAPVILSRPLVQPSPQPVSPSEPQKEPGASPEPTRPSHP